MSGDLEDGGPLEESVGAAFKVMLNRANVRRYLTFMIRSFRSKPLQSFFETGAARKLSVQNTKRLGRILNALDAATVREDMNTSPASGFIRCPGIRKAAMRSMPVEIGGLHLVGMAKMPWTST